MSPTTLSGRLLPAVRSFALLATFATLAGCQTARHASTPAPPPDAPSEAVVFHDADGTALRRERAAAEAPGDERRVVRSADLGLRVGRGETVGAIRAAATHAEGLGGYVAVERSDVAVFRVPDARLPAFLDAVAGLGRVTRRDVRARDVTDAYADLEARVSNARRTRDRLLALLNEAGSVQDVLAVERELARVTGEVEVLEGQLQRLRGQVALATVELRVGERPRLGPVGLVFAGLYEGVKWLIVG